MFCSQCGTKVDDNAKFCKECGTLVEFVAVTPSNYIDTRIPPKNKLENTTINALQTAGSKEMGTFRKSMNILFALLLVAMFAFVFWSKWWGDIQSLFIESPGKSVLETEKIKSLFKADPGKQAAVIVQEQLISPGSFQYVSSQVLWEGKSKDGEPAYVVSVAYDSQNAFGAMLRGCMLVSYYVRSDNKVAWNPGFGVRDGNEVMACNPSVPKEVLAQYAIKIAEINSFVTKNAN